MEKHKAETREARGTMWLDELAQDVRYSVRTFVKNPGFAVIAILTLALGIGANTAIFSVINAAFFAPYGVTAPEQLVRLWGQDLQAQHHAAELLGAEVRAVARSADVVRVTWRHDQPRADADRRHRAGAGQRARSRPARSSTTFGATPIAGRFFRADEERGANVAVLGEEVWRARFAADPAVVGRAITLDGGIYTVIGVSPRLPAFWDADVWTTESVSVSRRPRRHHPPRLQLSAAGRPLEAGRER